VSDSQPTEQLRAHRRSLWEYYDRRVTERLPGIVNAYDYWTGRGVDVGIQDIAAEVSQLEQCLRALPAALFIEVGAGPGTFTGLLPGQGVAIDQSPRALQTLRTLFPHVPTVRGDVLNLPLGDRSIRRLFAAHLYGLLLPEECEELLTEARRVASEILILDAGRPAGVQESEWQERTLHDGTLYRVFRRHFEAAALASEVGGSVLFNGDFYVLVSMTS
jgi:SAM-dependent methyltransferase